MDSRTVPQALKPFVQRVAREFGPVKVIMFGSHARGEAGVHSDYDLLVISAAFEQITFYDRHVRVNRLLREPIEVDVICLTPQEFKNRSRSLSIIGEAAREGVLITV